MAQQSRSHGRFGAAEPASARDGNGTQRERPARKPRAEELARKQRAKARRERPQPAKGSFADLGVPQELVAGLAEQGIAHPFPIQSATIPDALAGRDLLGRGQTGSGKTLAFALPMLARLMRARRRGKAPRGLVLSPTRELAAQIADVIAPLARYAGLHSVLVAGGMSYTPQLKALSRGVDIVIATPGRLIDLLDRGAVDLSQIEVSVLDEADEMCDMGFLPEVTAIWDEVPAESQHLLFSATLDDQVAGLAERYLREPIEHGVDPALATVQTMDHQIWIVHPLDKLEVLTALTSRAGRTLVFVRTQAEADRIAGTLRSRGVLAGSLHGGLRQGARTRVLEAFKRGDLPVLVATDVAARGIHVDDVSVVVQADPPHDAKDYLHRAGRTARAGEKGRVISLAAPRQRRRMAQIAEKVGVRVEQRRLRPGDEELDELISESGGGQPTGAPVSDDRYEALLRPARSGGGRRGPAAGWKRKMARRDGGGGRNERRRRG